MPYYNNFGQVIGYGPGSDRVVKSHQGKPVSRPGAKTVSRPKPDDIRTGTIQVPALTFLTQIIECCMCYSTVSLNVFMTNLTFATDSEELVSDQADDTTRSQSTEDGGV